VNGTARAQCIISKMKNKRLAILWCSFVITSLAASFVYFELSSIHSYIPLLGGVATINAILAFAIVHANNFAKRITIYVVLVFLAGQWWLLLWMLVILNWKLRGFAP